MLHFIKRLLGFKAKSRLKKKKPDKFRFVKVNVWNGSDFIIKLQNRRK